MSAADVDLVRTLIPGPDVDVAALFRDEAVAAQARAGVGHLFALDYECVITFPGSRTRYQGIDGLRQAWLDWLEPFEQYFTEIEDLIDLDGRVLALVRDRGLRPDVAVPIEEHGSAIWTVREGKVHRTEFFAVREEALTAAGLRPRAAAD